MKCYITPVGTYKDWTPSILYKWISNAGGHLESKITDQTTHLVVHDKAWKNMAEMVKKGLQLNKEEGRDIKIVSYDWLEDSICNKTRKKEGPYRWEKLDRARLEREDRKGKGKAVEGPKGHVGLMAEVFQESTEMFVDEKDRRRMERLAEEQRRVRREMEAEEKREREEARKEERRKQAKLFGKGAKKARNEIFSGALILLLLLLLRLLEKECHADASMRTENHHIYTDPTAFQYDILLTKIDTRHNRNERIALTVSPQPPSQPPARETNQLN